MKDEKENECTRKRGRERVKIKVGHIEHKSSFLCQVICCDDIPGDKKNRPYKNVYKTLKKDKRHIFPF